MSNVHKIKTQNKPRLDTLRCGVTTIAQNRID